MKPPPPRPLALCAIVFSTIFVASSSSQAATWTPIGPDGGALFAVAEAPNGRTLYASSRTAGVFKSVDGGRSWRRLPVALPGPGPLAVDAVSSALLYVGTSSGLFRTPDGGTTWEHVETRLPELATAPVSALVADPHRPGVAWAAFAPLRRLLQTTDGGATWKARDHGLGRGSVHALTAHPFLSGHLYAATDDGIWASRDGGASWLRLGLRGKGTVNVAVDAGTDEVVHALAIEAINHYGITTDRLYVLSRATHGSFVRDFGDDGPGNGIYTRVASDPLTPGRTYAATSFGTFVQTAPAGAWQRLPAGPSATVLPSRVRPDSLFRLEALVDGGGLFVSRDGGASWMHSDHGLNAGQLLQIEPDPTDPRRLYAVPTCCRLRRSEDGGASWETVGSDIPPVGLSQVLTDPGHPGTAYLATADSVWKTEDGGDHWRRLGIYPNVLALDPGGAGRPETLYGNDRNRPRLHRSRDGVASWEDLGDTGFSTGVLALSQGTTPPVLYANGYAPAPHSHHAYRDRLRRTTDDGTTWTTLLVPQRGDTIFTAIADVADVGAAGRRIYAAFFEADGNFRETSGGIFRSTDGGTTWTSLDVAAARPPVDTIAVDPRDSAHLYAGTPGGGIYESRDAGTTWSSIADDLPHAGVTHLTLDPRDPDRLYVSLLGGGAYVREGTE